MNIKDYLQILSISHDKYDKISEVVISHHSLIKLHNTYRLNLNGKFLFRQRLRWNSETCFTMIEYVT